MVVAKFRTKMKALLLVLRSAIGSTYASSLLQKIVHPVTSAARFTTRKICELRKSGRFPTPLMFVEARDAYPGNRLLDRHLRPPASLGSRQRNRPTVGGQFWTPTPRLTGAILEAE